MISRALSTAWAASVSSSKTPKWTLLPWNTTVAVHFLSFSLQPTPIYMLLWGLRFAAWSSSQGWAPTWATSSGVSNPLAWWERPSLCRILERGMSEGACRGR
jgi:hypothetical protein